MLERARRALTEPEGVHKRSIQPPQTPASTVARPYVRPKPRARSCVRAAPADLLVPVGDPPNPVKVFCPVAVESAVLDGPDPLVVDAIVLIVEVFTRMGFWAPQGLEVRQELWQAESPCGQALTQSVAACVHS